MKLRQNKDEEIDLRTIVDAELGNQINGMLPLDGSKKLTGVLETVGTDGAQIRMGASEVAYNLPNHTKGIWICCNCYYDGLVWKYSENGPASHIMVDGGTVMLFAYTDVGVKDATIKWSIETILTDRTGVKKSGDTISGALAIETQSTQLSLSNPLYPNKTTRTINNGAGTHIQDWKSATENIDLIMDSSATENSKKLMLHIPGIIMAQIYGEHNITISTVPPATFLGEGVCHMTY